MEGAGVCNEQIRISSRVNLPKSTLIQQGRDRSFHLQVGYVA